MGKKKVGSIGPHQMGTVDIPQTAGRQVAAIKRRDERREADAKKEKKAAGVFDERRQGKKIFFVGGNWRHWMKEKIMMK